MAIYHALISGAAKMYNYNSSTMKNIFQGGPRQTHIGEETPRAANAFFCTTRQINKYKIVWIYIRVVASPRISASADRGVAISYNILFFACNLVPFEIAASACGLLAMT